MEKKQAIQLISDTFNSKFDENQFSLFIKNLLNDIEPKTNRYSGQMLWDDYKDHINSYKRIGKYTDPEGELLDVLIVEVKTIAKLERARTSLRNFVIKHLKKFDKDFALVAFYAEEDKGTDWRFSFIKLEHQSYFDEEKDKVKIKEGLTPAKRYSFLVGEFEQSHTAKTQLLPLLQNLANNPTVEELEDAFSIEKVTDEFFNQYKDLYVKLYEHFNKDAHIKLELSKAQIDNARFTKKLLGQIVFLYFLQKKGWLGVPQNEKWGKGQKRFIQNLFDTAEQENVNFFKDKLQYLFYEALAKERNNEHSFYEKFDCRIPFLNGGLFEAEYKWETANITIPTTIFRNQEKNKAGDIGTGVLDVFDRYNFTIKEDEPLDKEVAVDPEMLGKVFENMLEITERKSKGAFYTPREIVHYMCQESLIHYLDNALEGKVKKQDIETYIRKGHNALENDQRVAKKGETKTYQYILPKSIRKNADLIDQKLTKIKICDPAIGSGAFPVGLLHELVNAQLVIKPHFTDKYLNSKLTAFDFTKKDKPSESRYIYRLKRHIIQESIYGVDIDASAIDIARLRLWLSLVVDEDDFDPIETLPNLDYKIVCGNSLISRYPLDMPIDNVFKEFNKKVQSTDYNNKAIKNLVGSKEIDLAYYKKLTNDFLLESSHDKKVLFRELISEIKNAFTTTLGGKALTELSKARGAIENLQQSDIFGKQVGTKTQISNAKKHFAKLEKEKKETEDGALFKNAIEWRFEFPNLLDKEGDFVGFDVVIGNPPYISISKLDAVIKKVLSIINYKTLSARGDLYEIFYENGNNILNEGGHLCYITSNKWMRANYGKSTRQYFIEETSPKILIDFGQEMIFSSAIVHSNVMLFQKGYNNNNFYGVQFGRNNYSNNQIDEYFHNNKVHLNYLNENVWAISEKKLIELKKKIELKGTRLAEWNVKISYGIKTGLNEAFIIDKNTANTFLENELNRKKIKKIVRGRDTRKYYTKDSKKWMIISPFKMNEDLINNFPDLLHHLKQFEVKLKKRGQVRNGQHHWLELDNNPSIEYFNSFEQPKIIFSEIVSDSQFHYDKKGLYPEASTFFISGENLIWLIAFLNSEPITNIFRFFYAGGELVGKFRYKKSFLETLPIPLPVIKYRNIVERIVNYIILCKPIFYKKSIDDLIIKYFESIIDVIVYEILFEQELKQAKKEVLKHLTDLKPINDEMSEEEKLAIIQAEFERLYDPNHPVHNVIETLDSIEEVRIIKEALK